MPEQSAHRAAVTGACFLAYFAMSGMLAPIGIVAQPQIEQAVQKALGLPVQITDGVGRSTWGAVELGGVAHLDLRVGLHDRDAGAHTGAARSHSRR